MKRIILDTNIYGKLIEEDGVMQKLAEKNMHNELAVYGSSVIRQELRATPSSKHIGTRKVRMLLLNLYDKIVSKESRNLKFNKLVETLSKDYSLGYKRKGGHISSESVINDFIIVGIATIYNLDIIVSDDERTMLSSSAIAAYKSVNEKYGLKNPSFMNYLSFKKELAR